VGIDRPLGIVGGGILVLLAARSLRDALRGGSGADSSADAAEGRSDVQRLASPATGFASMYGLTMTNPATILSFTALFASIGAGTGGAGGALAVVIGVFTGSIAWWALLTGLVAGLRARLTPRVVRALNIASALLIGGFGVVAVTLGIRG
jgi:threonine/homoserine/homoserine lactone efflux protein